MLLHFAALYACGFLQLPPGCIEGLAQRDIGVLVVRMIDHDFPARHAQVQIDLEMPSLLVMLAHFLNNDPAAGDVRMELLKLGGFFTYARLECFRLREIAYCNLQRNLH